MWPIYWYIDRRPFQGYKYPTSSPTSYTTSYFLHYVLLPKLLPPSYNTLYFLLHTFRISTLLLSPKLIPTHNITFYFLLYVLLPTLLPISYTTSYILNCLLFSTLHCYFIFSTLFLSYHTTHHTTRPIWQYEQ